MILQIGQRVDLDICYIHIPVEVGSGGWKIRFFKYWYILIFFFKLIQRKLIFSMFQNLLLITNLVKVYYILYHFNKMN